MGRSPKTPDMSAQNRAAEKQTEALEKEETEVKRNKETLALENTEKLRSTRRRGQGRSSLITTSETGVESKGYNTARSSEIGRIKSEGEAEKVKQTEKEAERKRINASIRNSRSFAGNFKNLKRA